MNIKKQLKSLSIISLLCAGFFLAPSSVMAERHHSNSKHQSNKSHQKHSSHKNRQHKSYSKKHHQGQSHNSRGHSRHNSHSHNSRNYSRHSHKPRHGHRHNRVNYYSPWYDNRYYENDGHFTFGYQNDHFGFTFRD